jgi:hypothetical protein
MSTRSPRARRAARPSRTVPASPVELPRELWLAGLGALAATGETATRAFGALVVRGERREPEVVAAVRRVADDARAVAESVVRDAAQRSRRAVDEAVERLSPTPRSPRSKNILHRLGDLADALL